MVFNPRREEEKLQVDLAKIRQTTRMRLGVVAGIVIIGGFQTRFPDIGGADPLNAAREIFRTVFPLVVVAAVGVLIVLALARRDTRQVEAAYESKRFRVPKRKTGRKDERTH